MKKLLLLLFLLPLGSYLSAQSYQGVADDIPIKFELQASSGSTNATISYAKTGEALELSGTNALDEGWLLVWNQEENISFFFRDVSEDFGKARGSVLIGTLREMNNANRNDVNNRPTVALFKN